MSKEAMKLALEAFSVIAIADNLDWIRHQAEQQAAALREALAEQPAQQEPDAFVPREAIRTLSGGANHVPATLTLNDDGGKAVAVFLSPQPAQRTWVEVESIRWEDTKLMAKLKEKNI